MKREERLFLLSVTGCNREEQEMVLPDLGLFHEGDIPEIHTPRSGKCVSA